MNGPRTNQFVAPTSFITSISRRRAKIDSRIVFAIRSVEAVDEQDDGDEEGDPDHLRDRQHAVRGLRAPAHVVHARVVRRWISRAERGRDTPPFTGVTTHASGSGFDGSGVL